MNHKNILIELRLGADVIIKSKQVRTWFVSRLIQNIKNTLQYHAITFTMENRSSLIYLSVDDPRALVLLKNIFGLSSYSVIEHQCPPEMDAIIRMGTDIFKDDVKNKTFGIRTKRRAPLPFRSQDINVRLGDNLNRFARGVDLENPEFPIFIDIDDKAAYFHTQRIKGAGGLPIGVSGKAVCLFSGGFDSPVAAWSMLKRGIKLEYIFLNLAGETYRRNVLRVAKLLAENWHHGAPAIMHIIDFTPIVKILKDQVNPKVIQVVLKRLFYRVATMAADKLNASGIVTGEALGQVSSQTLENFAVIEAATPYPVLRPLLGMDKQEIIDISRRIGTHDISALIKEHCQLTLGPTHTKCPLELAEAEEKMIPRELIHTLLQQRESLGLRGLTEDDFNPPELFIDHIPDNAELLNVGENISPRLPSDILAKKTDLTSLLKAAHNMDPNKIYVLYCLFGVQSAVAAEQLRERGLEAYCLRGGTRALKKLYS